MEFDRLVQRSPEKNFWSLPKVLLRTPFIPTSKFHRGIELFLLEQRQCNTNLIASTKECFNSDPSIALAARGSKTALPEHPTDPYHVAAILDLKRGWMGINNAHAIFRMHNSFRVHCLCRSSLFSDPKWRLRDKGLLADKDPCWRAWIQKNTK